MKKLKILISSLSRETYSDLQWKRHCLEICIVASRKWKRRWFCYANQFSVLFFSYASFVLFYLLFCSVLWEWNQRVERKNVVQISKPLNRYPLGISTLHNGSFKKKCQHNCSSVFCWSLLLFYSDKVHKQWLKVWFLTSQMLVLSSRINFVAFSTTSRKNFQKISMKNTKKNICNV